VKGRVGDFRDLVESESFGYFNGDSDSTGILRIFKRIFFFRECNAMLINQCSIAMKCAMQWGEARLLILSL
jgi:hypothetical protein